MKKTILHVGLPKTGTTSVQAFLSAAPSTDLLYCRFHEARFVQSRCFANRVGVGNEVTSSRDAGPYAETAVARAAQEGRTTIVISDEVLSQIHRIDVAALKKAIAAFRGFGAVRVIIYVRPYISWVESMLSQLIKNGHLPQFEKAKLSFGHYPTNPREVVNFYRGLDGVEVEVRVFGTNVLPDFVSTLDLADIGEVGPLPEATFNRSPSRANVLQSWCEKSGVGAPPPEVLHELPRTFLSRPAIEKVWAAVSDDLAALAAREGLPAGFFDDRASYLDKSANTGVLDVVYGLAAARPAGAAAAASTATVAPAAAVAAAPADDDEGSASGGEGAEAAGGPLAPQIKERLKRAIHDGDLTGAEAIVCSTLDSKLPLPEVRQILAEIDLKRIGRGKPAVILLTQRLFDSVIAEDRTKRPARLELFNVLATNLVWAPDFWHSIGRAMVPRQAALDDLLARAEREEATNSNSYAILFRGVVRHLKGDFSGAAALFASIPQTALGRIQLFDKRGFTSCRDLPPEAIFADTPPPLKPVEAIGPDVARGSGPTFVFSCNSVYLKRFGSNLIGSMEKNLPETPAHIHIINPDDGDRALIEALAARHPVSASMEELHDPERAYYACSRFLRAPEFLERFGGPVITCDIDIQFMRPIDDLLKRIGNADVGLNINSSAARYLPWRTVNAGLVYFGASDAGRQFADVLRATLTRLWDDSQPGARWWIDQNALFLARRHVVDHLPTVTLCDVSPVFGSIVDMRPPRG